MTLRISDLSYIAASRDHRRRGLLGWVAVTIDDALRLDGIALRRTVTGQLRLSFPQRRDQAGGSHPYIRPLSDAARRALEAQVFAALGLEGNVAP